jgi:hypothetical protein
MRFIMTKASRFVFLLSFLIPGCATAPMPTPSSNTFVVGKLRINQTNQQKNTSPEMISRCSGFILTEKQVRDFLMHASFFKGEAPDKYYKVLPCSATGTAVINRRKYSWAIRAGGIGEFFGSQDSFVMVCGKLCCDKVQGIC